EDGVRDGDACKDDVPSRGLRGWPPGSRGNGRGRRHTGQGRSGSSLWIRARPVRGGSQPARRTVFVRYEGGNWWGRSGGGVVRDESQRTASSACTRTPGRSRRRRIRGPRGQWSSLEQRGRTVPRCSSGCPFEFGKRR